MALQWTLRDDVISSELISASKPEQILENVKALQAPALTSEELIQIDGVLLGDC